MVAYLYQEPFQAASLEGCCISEPCPPNVITTPGLQQRRAELLHAESVLNLYILSIIPLLYYCSSFYRQQFAEEEAKTLLSTKNKARYLLTYLGVEKESKS